MYASKSIANQSRSSFFYFYFHFYVAEGADLRIQYEANKFLSIMKRKDTSTFSKVLYGRNARFHKIEIWIINSEVFTKFELYIIKGA